MMSGTDWSNTGISAGIVATMCMALPLVADTVTYTGTSTQHYNDPTAWSVQEVPHGGNDYEIASGELRSPTSAADGVFNGNSLTLGTSAQAKLELYGPYVEFKNNGLSIVNTIITQRYATPGVDGRIVTELAGTSLRPHGPAPVWTMQSRRQGTGWKACRISRRAKRTCSREAVGSFPLGTLWTR